MTRIRSLCSVAVGALIVSVVGAGCSNGGGASADDAIATVRSVVVGFDNWDGDALAGLMTPRLCKSEFEIHPFLGRNVIRYVYGNDVVTRLPPRPTGDFADFGREYRCDARATPRTWMPSAKPRTQISNLLELALAPLAFVSRQVPWLTKVHTGASLHDHLPHHYVSALTPPDVRSEFGD